MMTKADSKWPNRQLNYADIFCLERLGYLDFWLQHRQYSAYPDIRCKDVVSLALSLFNDSAS
jgi:hypothetical protein